MARACLCVRAFVAEEHRNAFDRWYRDDHVPLAIELYRPVIVRRFWSRDEPGVHVALYEFADLAAAQARLTGDVVSYMSDDFERAWPEGVLRTRDLLEEVEHVARDPGGPPVMGDR